MKVCLTYANWRFRKTQQVNGRKIIASGFFDKVILTSPRDLSKEFVRDYKHILKYRRLGGYGVWKPYIIKQTLMTLSSEDILCYVDADFHFCKTINPAIEMMVKWQQDIMPFSPGSHFFKESIWTKKDVFMLMNCDKPQWVNSPQRVSGLSLWRGGSTITLAFLDEWLHYNMDTRLSTDLSSQYPNDPDFKKHRHDQSIFSLLTKKYDLKALPFPTEIAKDSEYHVLVLYNPLRAHRPEEFLYRRIGRWFTLVQPFSFFFSVYSYLFDLMFSHLMKPRNNKD